MAPTSKDGCAGKLAASLAGDHELCHWLYRRCTGHQLSFSIYIMGIGIGRAVDTSTPTESPSLTEVKP